MIVLLRVFSVTFEDVRATVLVRSTLERDVAHDIKLELMALKDVS